MREYIKKFDSANSADGYEINDIPFVSTVSGVTPVNLICNEEDKKIEVTSGGTIEIVDRVAKIRIHYVFVHSYHEAGPVPADKLVVPPYTLLVTDLPNICPSDSRGGWNKSAGNAISADTTVEWNSDACIAKDTPVTLAIGTTKLIQDITYDDELLVWNFDDATFTSATPLWIKAAEVADSYWLCKFENGLELKLVGSNGKSHRVFNYTDQIFEYPQDCVGKEVYTENGITTLLSCELVNEEVEFYNVITNYHMNLFAGGVLTSCRYNNIYPIEKMKFVKDDSELVPYMKYNDAIPKEYYAGLRLSEQTISIADNIEYVHRLISIKL